ncbi:MAG TPA: hypothetical protein VK363_07175 [Pyrinomonadaceae bacterium]|nr:hypothetical protein [Pyrinomonadaceae bacterium]
MPVGTYYLSKTKEGKFGSVFLLKQLQESDSSGGGTNLLGSVVQWIDEAIGTDYPIPQVMTKPKALISELEKRRAELEIDGNVTLQIKVAGGSETIKLEKKTVFDLGVGPFPAIPLNFGLDIDFSKLKTLTMVFGEGTYSEYIPIGYMAALYKALKGKPSSAIGGSLLKAYISQILLARKYSVSFESTEKFDTAFEAKLKAFNQLPEIGGKVKVEKKSERVVKAEIDSPDHYVVGVTASLWQNLK